MNFTNVAYNSVLNPKEFINYYWNPTWGGSNNSFRTRDDYMYIDHIYMSGIKKGAGPANPVCGNGQIESGEQCDGTDLNGATCISQGFAGGVLSCHPSTCQYVTNACTNTTQPKPGDLNNDGKVDLTDVQRVLAVFGQSGITTGEDVNGDNTVSIYDLIVLARNWG